MDDSLSQKKALRKEMKALLGGTGADVYESEGRAAAARLLETPDWRRYKKVLLYVSMQNEFDTAHLIEGAFAAGKEVYVPKTFEDYSMRFYRIKSANGPWHIGAYDIKEPLDTSVAFDGKTDKSAFIAVPALAFSRDGKRLGRGRGFYDRFFASLPSDGDYFLCGLCLERQVVKSVPTEPFDRSVGAICTANEYIITGNGKE